LNSRHHVAGRSWRRAWRFEWIDRLREMRSGDGAHKTRDEVPAGWGLVAATKKQRLTHDYVTLRDARRSAKSPCGA
jgi:hypothetical protein